MFDWCCAGSFISVLCLKKSPFLFKITLWIKSAFSDFRYIASLENLTPEGYKLAHVTCILWTIKRWQNILWSGLQVSQIGFCLTGSISLIFLKAVAWVCYCNMVIWVWWDQSLVDEPLSFSAMTLLVGSIFHVTRKIVSEMTYNVSMGTLNPTIPTIPRCIIVWLVGVVSNFHLLHTLNLQF